MRISDWSSDVCSSDLTARLAPLGEQGATDFRSAVDIRSIGQVHPAHMRRPIIAVAKLLAGARAIVVFVEALPDQVGADPWCRFECDRRAKRPTIADVDVVLGGRVVLITTAACNRTRDAHRTQEHT